MSRSGIWLWAVMSSWWGLESLGKVWLQKFGVFWIWGSEGSPPPTGKRKAKEGIRLGNFIGFPDLESAVCLFFLLQNSAFVVVLLPGPLESDSQLVDAALLNLYETHSSNAIKRHLSNRLKPGRDFLMLKAH